MNDRASLLAAALEQVATLRRSGFRGDDGAVLHLLRYCGEGDHLVSSLWADLPEGSLREDVADLLGLLVWRTNDNGAAIMRTLERWIRECSDELKIWVAVHQEAYPFIAHADRINHLVEVAKRFPSLAPRCEAMIAQTREWERTERGAGMSPRA